MTRRTRRRIRRRRRARRQARPTRTSSRGTKRRTVRITDWLQCVLVCEALLWRTYQALVELPFLKALPCFLKVPATK